MEEKKQVKEWITPDVETIGSAKDIIKNIFTLGTGDTEPGMANTLNSS